MKTDSHRNIIRRDIFDGLKILRDPRAIKLAGEYSRYKYSYGGMHLLDIAALDCAMEFAKSHRKDVINVLAEALKNPYFRTRNYAAGKLAKLGAKSKLPLLKEILKSERRRNVKRSLIAAIKRLERGNSREKYVFTKGFITYFSLKSKKAIFSFKGTNTGHVAGTVVMKNNNYYSCSRLHHFYCRIYILQGGNY